MDRLEILEKLNEFESRKVLFEKMKNDLESYYMQGASIYVNIDTKDYNKSYPNNEEMNVNKNLFIIYVESEIEQLESRIQELLESLIKPSN